MESGFGIVVIAGKIHLPAAKCARKIGIIAVLGGIQSNYPPPTRIAM
jgi:hypothetical protein